MINTWDNYCKMMIDFLNSELLASELVTFTALLVIALIVGVPMLIGFYVHDRLERREGK